jgi:hypothetical protein
VPDSLNAYTAIPGVYAIIGRHVPVNKKGSLSRHSLQKLYSLLSIYRDKRYETFRYVLINDKGFIKDHVAVSAFHPGRTPVGPYFTSLSYFLFQIKKQALEMDYKIIVAHNHPSGNITPSDEDKDVSARLKEDFGGRYLGHIILDHGEFSYSGSGGSSFTQVKINSPPGPDPLVPDPHNEYAGVFIGNPNQEAFLRTAIRLDSGDKWNSDDWVPILFLNNGHKVKSLHYYHVTEFTGPDADINVLNKSAFIAHCEGAASLFALPVNNNMFNILKEFSEKIHIFMDAVYNGRSLNRETGKTNRISNYFPFNITYSSSFDIKNNFQYVPEAAAGAIRAAAPAGPFPAPENRAPPSPSPARAALPWPENFPAVIHFLDESETGKPWKLLASHPAYEQAKNNGDRDSAVRLAEDFMTTSRSDKIIRSLALDYPAAVIVPVRAQEENARNFIPSAMASFISDKTGIPINNTIIQSNKVSRSRKDSWYRFAYRPEFSGAVERGKDYILIDDVFSNGGSFSELRRHIESRGGNVVLAAAMTTGGHGEKLALSPQTALDLIRKHGLESINKFLREIDLYDGNYQALTEPEAFALLRSPSLDEARERILTERNAGIRTERRELFQAEKGNAENRPVLPGTIESLPAVHSPAASYDARVALRDAEQWAKSEYPNIYRRYNQLQLALNTVSGGTITNSIKAKLSPLRSDFINAYKILHLRAFDEGAYLNTVSAILNSQNKNSFSHTPVHIGYLPGVFNDIGYPSLPLFITPRHLYLIANKNGVFRDFNANYHDIQKDIIYSLQSLISDPQAVIALNTDKPSTLTLLDAYDRKNNQIGLFSTPFGRFGSTGNVNYTASLVLTMYGLSPYKLNDLANNIEDNLLYIKDSKNTKKEAAFAPPGLNTALERIGKGRAGGAAITPARLSGPKPDPSLGFSFLENNITRFKQSVNGYLRQIPAGNFHFARENEPAYPAPPSPALKKETVMADLTSSLQDARLAVEYLDRLRSIRSPQNRLAYHDAFTRFEAFSRLKSFPDFTRLEDHYRQSLAAFITRFPEAPPPASPPGLTALPLPSLTPWDFLSNASELGGPEEYRSYHNHYFTSFVPGGIKPVSAGVLALFSGNHALPLALGGDKPPYRAALYKQADEHGIALPGLIPAPYDVDRLGIAVVKNKTYSYASLLDNEYFARESRANRRMRLEYLELLLRAGPAERPAIHRAYAGISQFGPAGLAAFPQFDRLEDQYQEHLAGYLHDFPRDKPPFFKSLIGLSQPSPAPTPLRFLQDASQLASPAEYLALYDRRHGEGFPAARVRMVSPDTVALFITGQKLPAALAPYNPGNFAGLYKLAVHNGFVPLLDKTQPVIPSPREVDSKGAGIINERLQTLNALLSGPAHERRLSGITAGQPAAPQAPPDPAQLFVNFINNPFAPGVPVPPFGVTKQGTLSLMEGYSFLKTEDSGHTVCLSKPGEDGLPGIAKISKTQYDFIADAANAPAAGEVTPEILQKYEQTVNADINKTRPNTAAHFWHNYRVLSREEALNPQDAMATARRILYEMSFAEREKCTASMAAYEKQRGETYNDRIMNYYERAVKDIPLKNRSPRDGRALETLRHNDDTVSSTGSRIDNALRLKIGDPVKLNLAVPDLITGIPRKVLKTDLYLASSSENLNKVVVMSGDNTSKYVIPRDAFIKSMGAVEKRLDKRRQIEEKKEYRKSLAESVGVGW